VPDEELRAPSLQPTNSGSYRRLAVATSSLSFAYHQTGGTIARRHAGWHTLELGGALAWRQAQLRIAGFRPRHVQWFSNAHATQHPLRPRKRWFTSLNLGKCYGFAFDELSVQGFNGGFVASQDSEQILSTFFAHLSGRLAKRGERWDHEGRLSLIIEPDQ